MWTEIFGSAKRSPNFSCFSPSTKTPAPEISTDCESPNVMGPLLTMTSATSPRTSPLMVIVPFLPLIVTLINFSLTTCHRHLDDVAPMIEQEAIHPGMTIAPASGISPAEPLGTGAPGQHRSDRGSPVPPHRARPGSRPGAHCPRGPARPCGRSLPCSRCPGGRS